MRELFIVVVQNSSQTYQDFEKSKLSTKSLNPYIPDGDGESSTRCLSVFMSYCTEVKMIYDILKFVLKYNFIRTDKILPLTFKVYLQILLCL